MIVENEDGKEYEALIKTELISQNLKVNTAKSEYMAFDKETKSIDSNEDIK